MRKSERPPHQTIKKLLQLPPNAKPADVYACVVGCLGDALGCRREEAARISRRPSHYRAAWHSPRGRRYEGEGRSPREATLAAAARFVSQSEEAALLRGWVEPDPAPVAAALLK